MEYRKLALACSLATVLAACGGSDNTETPAPEPTPTPPPAPSPTLAGKVADGYLVGAKVCLDINDNKVCDDGEPSATSEAGGDFELEATQEQIDTYPLLVEVTADVVDEDTGETVSAPYSLTAPVGYQFVSPLSTMVQSQIDLGNTSDEAEAMVQALLNTTQALTEDFIAAQTNSELTAEQQAEFTQLHQVAQVTARVMANNLAAVQEAATAANISPDDLLTLIVDTVVDSLETIVDEVEAAGDDFDADAVAESETVAAATDVDGETLEDQVEVMNAQANTAAANLVAEVSSTGIFWFDGDYEDSSLWLDYGSVMYDADTTTTTEVEYNLVDGEFVESTNTYQDLLLGDNGWELVNDQFEITGLGDDGTITLTNVDFAGDSEVLSAEEFSLAGLNAKVFLQDHDNTWGWHKVMPADQSFSEGAKAFEIEATTVNDLYTLYYWDDCAQDELVGGLCNNIWSKLANGEEGPALTLASLISATASDGSIENLVGPYVAWNGQDNILAELVEGGTVNYYLVKWREDSTGQYVQSAHAYGTGTWRQETVSGVTLALMALPDDVIDFGDRDDEGEFLLSEYEGAVRQGDFIPAGTSFDDEVIFNVTAKNDIINNVDLSLLDPVTEPPELTACTTGDSEWDDANDQPVLSTLKSLAQYRELVTGCQGGTAASFTLDGVTGSQYKIYEDDGTLETLVQFGQDSGSFTDYNDDGTEDTTAFSWTVNDKGEIVAEVADETQAVVLRFYISLIKVQGDYVSLKGFAEEASWSEMDGSAGEVWGEVWKKVTTTN